jgi:hypothetical protein
LLGTALEGPACSSDDPTLQAAVPELRQQSLSGRIRVVR